MNSHNTEYLTSLKYHAISEVQSFYMFFSYKINFVCHRDVKRNSIKKSTSSDIMEVSECIWKIINSAGIILTR